MKRNNQERAQIEVTKNASFSINQSGHTLVEVMVALYAQNAAINPN